MAAPPSPPGARVAEGGARRELDMVSTLQSGGTSPKTDDTDEVPALGVPERGVDAPRPMQVLLADDTQLVRMFVTRLLEFAGHEVHSVETGRLVLDAVRGGDFDLVLMDVQMPELNGLEATIALRASGCTLPVLALTASTSEEERHACLEAGMNGFLAKPFTLAAFDAEWRRIRHAFARGPASVARPGM